MQRRFFYFDHGQFGMNEETVPELQADQILLRTTRSHISVGTETACNTGKPNWKVGRHGYANVGRVVQVGSGVNDHAIGDRLVSFGIHTDYLILSPQDKRYPVPPEVTDEEASFLTLSLVALYLVERATIALGQPVVLVGLGTVGQLALQFAGLNGAGRLIAVETDAFRRDLALQLGASTTIPPSQAEWDTTLGRMVPGSAAPVFIEASGSAAAVRWILDVAPLRSRIVLCGNYTQEVAVNPLNIVEREIEIIGAHQPQCPEEPVACLPYNRQFNCHYILENIRQKKLRVRELFDGLISPEEVIPFYKAARDNQPRLRQPIIRWE